MSRYRYVFQCKECKKVYTEYWKDVYAAFGGAELCPKCGSVEKFKHVIAKPKLFRLRGWEVKEQKYD